MAKSGLPKGLIPWLNHLEVPSLAELTTVDIGIYFHYHTRQSNIQLTCYIPGGNSVQTRLRCPLLNCNYTLQVLQQVATND